MYRFVNIFRKETTDFSKRVTKQKYLIIKGRADQKKTCNTLELVLLLNPVNFPAYLSLSVFRKLLHATISIMRPTRHQNRLGAHRLKAQSMPLNPSPTSPYIQH